VQSNEQNARVVAGTRLGVYQKNVDLSAYVLRFRKYSADHKTYELVGIGADLIPNGARIVQFFKDTETHGDGGRQGRIFKKDSEFIDGYLTEAMRRECVMSVPEGTLLPSALQ